jgi:hypothetical protein
MMLTDRAHPGDHQRARRILTEAQEIYTQVGMHSHGQITKNLIE